MNGLFGLLDEDCQTHDESTRLDWIGMNGLIDPILKLNPTKQAQSHQVLSEYLAALDPTPTDSIPPPKIESVEFLASFFRCLARCCIASLVSRINIVCLAYRVCDLPNCNIPSQRCFARSWFDSYRAIPRQRARHRDTRDASRPPR